MTLTQLSEESITHGGFRVPQFEVKMSGAVVRDITHVTYTDDIKAIDTFEMTVNNWDPTTRQYKYIGSETDADLLGSSAASIRYKQFEPSLQPIQLSMGYLGDLRLMLTGHIKTMEPSFPSGGAPTLAVRGMNVLQQFRTKQYSDTFEKLKDSQIALQLNTKRDDKGQKRIPATIAINTNAMASEPQIDYVAEKNQYDIDFLYSRARERGYVIFVADPGGGSVLPTVYYGPSQGNQQGLRDVTYQLDWGKTLLEFKPTLTTANQISAVTVHGWNRSTKKAISERVTIDDPKFNQNPELRTILKGCEAREEIVVERPVRDAQEARNLAFSILSDRFKEMVKATGTSIGLPDLRAGQQVAIGGLGSRISGLYFITTTTHTIGEDGYRTQFTARKETPDGFQLASWSAGASGGGA